MTTDTVKPTVQAEAQWRKSSFSPANNCVEVADLADAIAAKQAPAADGAAALHTLETTVAAYASAALGRTVAVPLPTDGPLHRSGVLGLRDLAGADAVPADSPVRRRTLFGLTPTGA